ncbi:MAG: 2-C-methyl-D-erythritol 2,4-cyclodiphosphate synthase [Provencibacterium sp.]|jgi:2-C-methyl-D-erythritol 2,4-cyclodiphosphate synthase|nr:2-C-methyl-D-erythritol 2,4-cyclodiphosphate synthase [Provencibacterium sp.]
MMRIGHGYDVHRLTPGRKLRLGGVEIPSQVGLLGHSDADVALHAVMDAILGALGRGDIGRLFPDSDPKYKDIDSRVLLSKVFQTMVIAGYRIGNLDITIIAQAPRLSPYVEEMRAGIAHLLACEEQAVNIKATTEEGLGFTGHGEGIACHAVVLLAD